MGKLAASECNAGVAVHVELYTLFIPAKVWGELRLAAQQVTLCCNINTLQINVPVENIQTKNACEKFNGIASGQRRDVSARLPRNDDLSVSGNAGVSRNTTALFARVNKNSERVILPINDSALDNDPLKPAFYCVHSVSGVAGTDFLDLARRLEPAVRFYGIQAPPKMKDPEFGSSVELVAEHYVEALLKFQPSGPIIIGGYCVGAVIALAMARKLRQLNREVGPLLAIDGAPENVAGALNRWRFGYWRELARNLPGWMAHGDLIRKRNMRTLMWSLFNNTYAISKGALGLRRGEKLGGGFAIDGVMDVTNYEPEHKMFVNRLFGALFKYHPEPYSGPVIVYEAKVTPLLYLPQMGRTWQKIAPNSHIVEIVGTHIGMMHEPYVGKLADEIRGSIIEFFGRQASGY